MECLCGYNCGTAAAFEKHLARFPDDPAHRALLPGEAPKRPTRAPIACCPAVVAGGDSTAERASSFAAALRAWGVPEVPKPLLSGAPEAVRLVLVRHGRSENRGRAEWEPAMPDPGLNAQGLEQAEALGERLAYDLAEARPLLVLSSPARRCLLTIQPALRRLRLPPGSCICHGAGYEFRGCGTEFPGTPAQEIMREFGDYECVGFRGNRSWDYRGGSPKETFEEIRARARFFLNFLRGDAVKLLFAQHCVPGGQPTLILCGHQTLSDLLLLLLLDGRDTSWEYGSPMYKLQNTGIMEVMLYPDGTARQGYLVNDGSHLQGVGGAVKSRPGRRY
eukprot:TRINITY_DN23661_c0_g1_i1.p1 TRINITY_DN23661_c0_g1~~TRINITY_DN23661_c0_g1_i1.p1  ORF type:complete len:361 (-),score=56.95 TRINITY_DN23661_c0_g1_i1:95-1096(-)